MIPEEPEQGARLSCRHPHRPGVVIQSSRAVPLVVVADIRGGGPYRPLDTVTIIHKRGSQPVHQHLHQMGRHHSSSIARPHCQTEGQVAIGIIIASNGSHNPAAPQDTPPPADSGFTARESRARFDINGATMEE